MCIRVVNPRYKEAISLLVRYGISFSFEDGELFIRYEDLIKF